MTRPSAPVTVVIPAFEAAGTVRRAIDSVLAQTFEDFVLHVIDDGSVIAPVPEDLPDDPRLVVDRLPMNGGYAHVTNHAIRASDSEWMTFVDADDTVGPEYLERMLAAGQGDRDVDLVFVGIARIAAGGELPVTTAMPARRTTDAPEAVRAILRGEVDGCQHVLLRRPRPVAIEGQAYSDLPFVLEHAASARRVAYVSEPLYFYAVHDGSVTGRLRESVWDLIALDGIVEPILARVFEPREAAELGDLRRALARTTILNLVAKEPEDSELRRAVTAWCRAGITPGGIVRLVRQGRRGAAASWALAKVSPRLHQRAYHVFDRVRRR